MLQMLNTVERSEQEWRQVVLAADSRLELTRIFKPKGSWDSIIEISLNSFREKESSIDQQKKR